MPNWKCDICRWVLIMWRYDLMLIHAMYVYREFNCWWCDDLLLLKWGLLDYNWIEDNIIQLLQEVFIFSFFLFRFRLIIQIFPSCHQALLDLLLEFVGFEDWLLILVFGFVLLQVWAFNNEVSSFLAIEATFLFSSRALVTAASA